MTTDTDTNPSRVSSWAPLRPTAADLTQEVREVIADLTLFSLSPLVRPWHTRWGATAAEVCAPMPGDDVLPRAHYRCTPAITVAAPPEEVWPWLVQVGCLRAGGYSDDPLATWCIRAPGESCPTCKTWRWGRAADGPVPAGVDGVRRHVLRAAARDAVADADEHVGLAARPAP